MPKNSPLNIARESNILKDIYGNIFGEYPDDPEVVAEGRQAGMAAEADMNRKMGKEKFPIEEEPGLEPSISPVDLAVLGLGSSAGKGASDIVRLLRNLIEDWQDRRLHKKSMTESLLDNKRYDPKTGKLVPDPKVYK